jgi:hypothetical protein
MTRDFVSSAGPSLPRSQARVDHLACRIRHVAGFRSDPGCWVQHGFLSLTLHMVVIVCLVRAAVFSTMPPGFRVHLLAHPSLRVNHDTVRGSG